jgi:transposase
MMTLAQMQEAITKLTQEFVSLRNENEALRRENEALRMDNDSIRALSTTTHNQYLALAESTKLLIAERDELKKRVSELEAVNKKLTDMLWGRRSERRIGNNETPFLDFGDDLPSLQELKSEALPPDVIIAQAAAQNALDLAKLAELKARREARQARQQAEQSRETFPEHMERRDVVLDLPEDQKEGLKLITTKVTERLRFEKPTVYVERILRRVYARTTVRAGSNESAIVAPPPPPAIVEGCKYDYSIIAAIACMKFAFYMSTYREQNFFGQSGWYPSRSTLNELLNYAVNSIVPLFAQMEKSMMDQSLLFGDATEITVLLRGELAEEEQVVLAKRKKDRHKEREAIKRNQRSKGLTPTSEKQSKNSEGSARSYAWLYSGSDAPNELMPNPDIPPHERPPPN